MKLFRKVFWPSAIVLGLLVFMGAVGQGARTAEAARGDICMIEGPLVIEVGDTVLYGIRIEDGRELLGDIAGIHVMLDDVSGNSDITSIVEERFGNDGHVVIPATDEVFNLQARTLWGDDNWDKDTFDDLKAMYGYNYDPDVCGLTGPARIIQDGILNEDLPALSGPEQAAVIASIIADLNALVEDCDDIALNAAKAAIAAGATLAEAEDVEDFVFDICEVAFGNECCENVFVDDDDEFLDAVAFVDVTCTEAGRFQLSAVSTLRPNVTRSIQVVCTGDVFSGDIAARPTTVEIVPSLNNTSHSLITVQLWDRDGKPAAPGTQVTFLVNRCSIETSGVDTEAEYLAALGVFGPYNVAVPSTGGAIESSAAATASVDTATRQQDDTTSFTIRAGLVVPETGEARERTIAAAIVGCNVADAPGATPGPLTVTAIVDRASPLASLVLTTEITVVGPPAANGLTVTAAPSNLICGEKATISVRVLDSIGQPVSDHTFVEAVTNFGGVLAGTGAVAGQQGLVSPVSSTVAETFGGNATIFLLTSTTHVGKYEVVVTTGGGGGVTGQLVGGQNVLGGLFTTAPISVQVTVECRLPATAAPAAPTTTGPATGQGITPPSTGDAGLASTESSSWVVAAMASVVAALVFAGFALKVVREEN